MLSRAAEVGEILGLNKEKRLLDLMGKLEWDAGFDYKAERKRD